MTRISVRYKPTGEAGSIDDSEFNSAVFELASPQSSIRSEDTVRSAPPQDSASRLGGGSFLDMVKGVNPVKIGQTLFPATTNIAQDVGTTLRQKNPDIIKANAANDTLSQSGNQQVQNLLKRAALETDPVKKKAYLENARGLASDLGKVPTDMASGDWSSDVNKDYATRGLASGAELAPFVASMGTNAPTAMGRIASMGVQGAESSGLRTLLSAKDMTPEERIRSTGKSALLGFGIAGGLQAGSEAIKGLSSVGQKTEEAGNKLRQNVRNIKQPASIYGAEKEKAINNTLNDLNIKGTPAQQYEQLQPKMAEVEGKINDLANANPNITVSKEAIKQSFLDNLKSAMRAKDLTNAQATSEVDGYLDDLTNAAGGKNTSGFDLGTLRGFKKIINEDYQPIQKVLDNGGALTPRQKVIESAWDSLDNAVQNASPELKKLLTQESNLYKAAPSLSAARFNPPTLRAFGTSVPAGVTNTAKDLAGRGVAAAGRSLQKTPATLPDIGSLVNPLIPVAASNNSLPQPQGTSGGNTDTSVLSARADTMMQPQGQMTNIGKPMQNQGLPTITGYSPEENYRAYQKALAAGDRKAAAALRQDYEDEVAYQKTQGAGSDKVNGSAFNALNAVSQMEDLYQKKGRLGVAAEMGTPGTGDYQSAAYAAADQLFRAQSKYPPQPAIIKDYMYKIFPNPLYDDDATFKRKMARVKSMLENLKYKAPTENQLPDITAGQ